MRLFTALCALFLFSVNDAAAQAASDGVTSFQQNSESWRRQQDAAAKPEIISNFVSTLGDSAVKNISDAEQVFCYEVASKPAGFSGYTMNDMAVTGFCGVLNKELTGMIVEQLFATQENVSFTTSESCSVNPRLVLRFVRGVDYTDVLISSPCHSIAVFYSGSANVFNFKPSAELINTMVDSFNKNRVDFVSPALLNQLLPIGVVQTAEQQKLVDNKGIEQPARSWAPEPVQETPADTGKSGWNNLAI